MQVSYIFPAGKPLYTTRQSKAMTVGADTQTISVPTNKLMLVYWGWVTNNSGQNVDVTVTIEDSTPNEIARIRKESPLANGDWLEFPNEEGTRTINNLGNGAFPLLLFPGQRIKIVWAANAGKAGTSYYYIAALAILPGVC